MIKMNNKTGLIIVLTGLTGTGKTTLQRLIKKGLGLKSILLGRLLEAEANRLGISVEKHVNNLIKSGGSSEAVVESLKPQIKKICKGVSAIMVEEVHRPEDFKALKAIFPEAEFFMVEVKAHTNIRRKRIMQREKISEAKARDLMRHYDKMQGSMRYTRLVSMSDIKVINNGLNLKTYYSRIINGLKQKGPAVQHLLERLKRRRGRKP
jgi:cytidylate kinase